MKESPGNRISFGLKESWSVSVEANEKQVIRITNQSIDKDVDLGAYRNIIEICALRLLASVERDDGNLDEMAAFDALAKESKLRPDERAEALRWFLHGRLTSAPLVVLAEA